ncbi:Protein maternal effect lethal 26 [Halotydeus destructor]|nr:Protein maternal effect lethal 26 [Halotydeus destructor]
MVSRTAHLLGTEKVRLLEDEITIELFRKKLKAPSKRKWPKKMTCVLRLKRNDEGKVGLEDERSMIEVLNRPIKLNRRELEPYTENGDLVVRICIQLHGCRLPKVFGPLIKFYKLIGSNRCDYTILVPGGSLKVFKEPLRSRWPYFENMLNGEYLDCSHESWKVRDIQGLVNLCANYLFYDIEIKDALSILVLSDLFGLYMLKDRCMTLVFEALAHADMAQLPGYEEFRETLDYILSSNYLEHTLEVICKFADALRNRRREITFKTPFAKGISWKLCLTTSDVISAAQGQRRHGSDHYYDNYGNASLTPPESAATANTQFFIEVSKVCGHSLKTKDKSAVTTHDIRIKKCFKDGKSQECNEYLTFDAVQLEAKVLIGCLEDLKPYTENGSLVTRVSIAFETYVHRKEQETLVKLYRSIDCRHCDFEISTNGGSLRVFRNVLCLKWPYFEAMIDADAVESSSSTWSVDDISYDTMRDIILYVYCNAVTLDDKQQVKEILKAAHRYQLQALVEACAKYLFWDVDFADALEVLVLSDLYDLVDLKERCSELISKALVRTDMKDLPGYEAFSEYSGLLRLVQECLQLSVRRKVL